MIKLLVNGKRHELDIEPEMPLLWALRDELGFTGTKFGCGIGQCGACTVHINGAPVRACVTAAQDAEGAAITTIEGLAHKGFLHKGLHPVQQAWIAEEVPQCGYCQPGQIMAAAALLSQNPNPTDRDIDQAMTNICRCGTYSRIRSAIHRVAAAGHGKPNNG